MVDPVIKIFSSVDELAVGFAETLVQEIDSAIVKKKNVHICLSGGNTPKAVFRVMANDYAKTFDWKKVHFFWGDERCVPATDPQSNYGEARRILFDNINIPLKNIHFINGKNNPEVESKRYAQELMQHVPVKNDIPSFDIMILGMGDDGHTASIFPNSVNLLNKGELCAVAEHPISGQKRITLTGKALNNALNTWFLVAGKDKSEILKKITQHHPEAVKYPVYFIRPQYGNLVYFADKEAASGI